MKKTLLDKTTDKLVNAFLKDKIISPLPLKYTKKLSEAQKVRKMCESKIKEPIIGFKAAGTGIPVMKKLKLFWYYGAGMDSTCLFFCLPCSRF